MTLQIFHCEQNSEEWVRARLGIPTASEFKSILAKGEGKMRRGYLYKLAGERLTGEPADNYTNAHMERGHAMEDEARRLYSFMADVEPERVGFLRRDGVGCSPDSLVGDDGMLEIKTRLPHLQIELLVADRVPPEHMAQLQGLLWVSGRAWVDFVSFWPRLPLYRARVERVEGYIATLADEVGRFCRELDDLTERMVRAGATRVAA